ncbi:arylamine N-acetyltransferase [Vitiosangium sp. GDMCC 1.1324]|uniref:arylamine N-acetyltransferase family protein n=1 Tax=Vitiosangium sp. (strain GDMCC 1.1324) TaxID=2138576 RepID=UPI000D353F2A|nr:arylamine N-acetyltransferase [Vitiosangium sp. GDMCC 1.1324]PTL78526.1 acetyltransferase [Vitiosangium sp. GDMCC 1.1324]
MDVGQYLQRIGYEGPLEPTLETLRALHLRHLESVPFENLDIHARRPIVLDEEAFFDKVVRRRRGGFCYELNGLFALLLRALGFQVTYLSGRVSQDGIHDRGPEFDHLLLEITLDGPWLVDVGFGDSFAEPLPLAPGQWASQGQMFRLEQRGDDWRLTQEQPDGTWKLHYVFTRVPRQLQDFSEMCRFHQTSPESFFLKNQICSRKTATGRVTLSGQRLIITEAGQREVRVLERAEEAEQALLELFGVPRGSLGLFPFTPA